MNCRKFAQQQLLGATVIVLKPATCFLWLHSVAESALKKKRLLKKVTKYSKFMNEEELPWRIKLTCA